MGTKPFADFAELAPETRAVLAGLGFTHATPVQEACLPLFCGHKDVAVDACTGSGKTLAFILPIVERLRRLDEPLRPTQVGALVISPTRELAAQIHRVAQPFLATVPWLTSLLLVGGSDPSQDVAAAEAGGCNLIVGTPGRIADVLQRSKAVCTRSLEVLVLDEADRLLDLGFREQLDGIMQGLPRQRRTGLFSATQTEAVRELARAGLRNPVRVKVAVRPADASQAAATAAGQRTPAGLSLTYRVCAPDEKLAHLIQFLQEHRSAKVIAYVLTCACVDLYAAALRQLPGAKGLSVRPLHGRMKQAQRQAALAAFAEQDAGCLLCTDVAARGLDIPAVDWVLQLDAPQQPDAFVHRAGRTARAGATGAGLLLLLPHERPYVDLLRVRKVPLEPEPEPSPPSAAVASLAPALRSLAEADRDVLEKGVKAFVSYIRGYREHACQYIFRLQDLDLGALARACGLLRLPKMPEMRKVRGRLPGFEPSPVDPASVKFRDKARQKAREKALAEKAAAKAAADAAAAPAEQQQQQQGRQQQRQGKQQQQAQQQQQQKEGRLSAAKRRLLEERQDEADFLEEYRLLKRLRRGKISKKEFDIATGLLEAEAAAPAASDLAAEEQPPPQQQQQQQQQPKQQGQAGKGGGRKGGSAPGVKPIRQGLKELAQRKQGLLGPKRRKKKRRQQPRS